MIKRMESLVIFQSTKLSSTSSSKSAIFSVVAVGVGAPHKSLAPLRAEDRLGAMVGCPWVTSSAGAA